VLRHVPADLLPTYIPAPILQEASGNVIKNGKRDFYLVAVVVVVVVNQLIACTQTALLDTKWLILKKDMVT
jgi:hypothetical protein